jgi:hypothetical protein
MTGAIPDKSFATSLTPLLFASLSEPAPRAAPKTLVDGLTSVFAYC